MTTTTAKFQTTDTTARAYCRSCGGRVTGHPLANPTTTAGIDGKRALIANDGHPCATTAGLVRTDGHPVPLGTP